jgi:hypothetical protein
VSKSPPIVTPIALDKTSSALICTPWFVQLTEYPPMEASYRPLVNGEEAFGALYDAIKNAKAHHRLHLFGFPAIHVFQAGWC